LVGDPELFFPLGWGAEHTFQIRQAKAVCRKCPLIADCMDFALETHDQHAILAGTTPAERNLIQQRLDDPYTNTPGMRPAA
jgi:WhiB family redox-sensing transcriptional regulator